MPTRRLAVQTLQDRKFAHLSLSVARASEKRPFHSVHGMQRRIRPQFLRPEKMTVSPPVRLAVHYVRVFLRRHIKPE